MLAAGLLKCHHFLPNIRYDLSSPWDCINSLIILSYEHLKEMRFLLSILFGLSTYFWSPFISDFSPKLLGQKISPVVKVSNHSIPQYNVVRYIMKKRENRRQSSLK